MSRTVRLAAAGLLVLGLTVLGMWERRLTAGAGEAPTRDTAALGLPPIALLEEVVCDASRDFRLLFVGDVHGQYRELMELVEGEAGGLDDETTVVLLGDVVSKGPDSARVVDYALRNSGRVKMVLGNHDLATLFAYANPELNRLPLEQVREHLLPLRLGGSPERFVPRDLSKVKQAHSALARQLGFERLQRFALQGSLALRFVLPAGETLYAVHGGMLPGDFVERTPSAHSLTEMKFVDPADWSRTAKRRFPGAERWFKLWARGGPPHTTVLYGHDAKRGLNLRDRTKGLDSGCVKGGRLSALEYRYTRSSGLVGVRLLQTQCGGQ